MPNMDVLKALDELKDAGVEERSARAMIRLVSEAVELQAVTKPDLERECTAIRASLVQATTELRGELAGLRVEMDGLRVEMDGLRGEMDGLRGEMDGLRGGLGGLRGEFEGLRDETKKAIADLREDMTAFHIEVLREMAALRDSVNARLLTTVGLQFGGTALLLGGFYALLR